MVFQYTDDFWYAPYRGKWCGFGGTVIADTKEDIEEYEMRMYKNQESK